MKRLGLFALIVVLAAGVRSLRVTAFEQHQQSQTYEDVYYLPPPSWLPVLSAGYNTALADLLWCRSLVYFGEEFIRQGQVKHLFGYGDAILVLDPDFRAPYRWLATVAMYRAGPFDVDEALRAVNYLRVAVKRWPNDGELAWDLGSILRFEIYPATKDRPELRKRIEEEAAESLTTAAMLGAGPPWLALNSSSLLAKLGKTEQAIQHLEEVYGTVQDEMTKKELAQRLAALRSETYAAAVSEANEQFAKEQKQSYPYLSPTAFFVLGPKAKFAHFDMLARYFLPADTSEQVFEDEQAAADSAAEGAPASGMSSPQPSAPGAPPSAAPLP